MFPNRGVGHNSLPPGGGGIRGSAGMPPMHYQQGLDPMMNGYAQPQGYSRSGGGGVSRQQQYAMQQQQQSYHLNQQQINQHHHLNPQQQQLKEQRDQENARRQAMKNIAAKKQEFINEDLFQEPIKLSDPATPGIQADKVLGNYKSFQANAVNTNSQNTLVGVDYQPPTPAPVQPQEDDDEIKPVRKIPTMNKPPQNSRLPSNMDVPIKPPIKPRSHQQPPPTWPNNSSMAPPVAPPSHRINGTTHGPLPSYRPPPNSSSGRISVPSTNAQGAVSAGSLMRSNRPGKLTMPKPGGVPQDEQVDKMMQMMLGPDLPSTPLTGIITPRVENTEDRGVQQHKPRYLGGGMPDKFFDNSVMSSTMAAMTAPLPTPLSRLSESDSDKETVPNEDTKEASFETEQPQHNHQQPQQQQQQQPDKNARISESSSTEESSSDSDSEGAQESDEAQSGSRSHMSDDNKSGAHSILSGSQPASMEKPPVLSEDESEDEPIQKRDYNLTAFMKTHPTPPTTSSTHSNNTLDPSPRPYQPTPSPSQSIANPSPRTSQSGGNVSASPRTLSGVGHLTTSPLLHGTSPRSSFMPGLPATMGPNSSMDRRSPILSPARQRLSQHSPLNSRHASPRRIGGPTKQEINKHIEDVMNIPETLAPMSCSDEETPAPAPPPTRTKASSKSYRTTPTNNLSDKKSLPHSSNNTTSENTRRKQSRKRKRELPTMPASSEDSDDSDHTPPPSKKGLRSASASPRKAAAAASQATPSPRKAGSGHSTPVRRTPNSRHKHTPKSNLSESEDETDSPPLLPQKTDNNQKTKALMAMFGKKAAKGKGAGKGKGGKGKGGINFIVGETDDEESRRDKSSTDTHQQHNNNSSATQHNIPPQTIKQEAPDSPAIHSPAQDKHISPAARGPRRGSATVDQDLALSDEDEESCRLQQSLVRRQSPLTWRPDGRPSLVCSIPLSRVSRSFGDPRISSQSQKEPKGSRSKFSCDTYGDNTLKCNNKADRPLSHSERISAEASSRLEAASRDLPERPASARSTDTLSRDRRSSGSLSWRTGGGGSDHRKAQERTISQEKRQSSPGSYYEWEKRSRLQEQDYDDESQSGADSAVHHHPTSYMNGGGEGLMPPPRINGYVGGDAARRIDDETDIEEIQDDARKLKREADSEENMEIKCTKYLKAILLFCQSAMRSENDKELTNAVDIYKQTIKLIKCILKPFIPKRQAWPPKEQTDIRLLVMSLRAQSLLNLKMYKLNKHKFKDLQKQINEVLTKSNNGEENVQGGEHGHLSPTPSPAGSEGSNCSKSSGYTSSGERERPGVVSITKSTLENQFNIAAYLSQCHELWEQAELFLNKGNCEDFFRRLDEECGALTLHSDLSKLTKYTKTGLDTISQEYSSMHQSPITQHRNS